MEKAKTRSAGEKEAGEGTDSLATWRGSRQGQ